jgi:formamidopyrimidine-DNA glycosylase
MHMPELPEVETTRLGVLPHVLGRRVTAVIVRDGRLRWPVPTTIDGHLAGRQIVSVQRRAKYLLFRTERGTLLVHLGMSGSLRVLQGEAPVQAHEHVDLVFDNGSRLRYRDPRRFGCILWIDDPPEHHPLLRDLGPEPLGPEFTGARLYKVSRNRRVPVKSFIMDAHVVAGVGNIYANEALFRAAIAPKRSAGRISEIRYEALQRSIKAVLDEALRNGGTTLRDFVDSTGQPGYFSQRLAVYGRAGEPCLRCKAPLRAARIGQRASVYCGVCQR